MGASVSLPSPLSFTRFYILYEQIINIIKGFAFSPPDQIYVLVPLRMHFQRSKVPRTALKVFSMHLGGNCRWVPLSFEKNNNKKKYIAHINFTLPYLQLYLLFSCISEARFSLFLSRKILVLPHQFGQHTVQTVARSPIVFWSKLTQRTLPQCRLTSKQQYHPSHSKCCIVARTRSLSPTTRTTTKTSKKQFV